MSSRSRPTFNAQMVEESAQKLIHYERTMQLNLLELRKGSADRKALRDLVSKSAQGGHRWPPAPEQRDAYMKHMDTLCYRDPSSDKERMEAVLACHSANTCYMLFYINELEPKIRTRIMDRYRDLSQAFSAELFAMQQELKMTHRQGNKLSGAPASRPIGGGPISASGPTPSPYSSPPQLAHRPLTFLEKSSYLANPITAIGKHFVLEPDSTEPLAYKIAGVRASEGQVVFEVLIAGCFQADDLKLWEVERMMNNSDVLE